MIHNRELYRYIYSKTWISAWKLRTNRNLKYPDESKEYHPDLGYIISIITITKHILYLKSIYFQPQPHSTIGGDWRLVCWCLPQDLPGGGRSTQVSYPRTYVGVEGLPRSVTPGPTWGWRVYPGQLPPTWGWRVFPGQLPQHLPGGWWVYPKPLR